MKQITVLHKITYPFININVLHLQRNWRVMASQDWCGCSASGISLGGCDDIQLWRHQCCCSATRIYRWVRVEMFLWRHGLVRLPCQWNLFVGGWFWSFVSSRLISHVNKCVDELDWRHLKSIYKILNFKSASNSMK